MLMTYFNIVNNITNVFECQYFCKKNMQISENNNLMYMNLQNMLIIDKNLLLHFCECWCIITLSRYEENKRR